MYQICRQHRQKLCDVSCHYSRNARLCLHFRLSAQRSFRSRCRSRHSQHLLVLVGVDCGVENKRHQSLVLQAASCYDGNDNKCSGLSCFLTAAFTSCAHPSAHPSTPKLAFISIISLIATSSTSINYCSSTAEESRRLLHCIGAETI